MMSDFCGSRLFMSLPDDVFILLTDSVSPRDLCSISLCCTSLNTIVSSDKVWLSQCDSLGIVNSQADLVEWRNGVMSYKCLCKFMFGIQPLLGIWVHQNPELGNVVYVMQGFLSVVGCRILPQEVGPLGLLNGSLLWAPVFEIICGENGELVFLLHGQDKDGEYLYPGSMEPVDRSCDVLLLEVEPRMQSNGCKLLRSKSLGHPHLDWESMRWNSSVVAFDRLEFDDRQKLLEIVMSQVGFKVPDLASGPLFPRCGDGGDGLKKDLMLLSKRRLLLIKLYQKGSGEYTDWQTMSGKPSNTTRVVAREPKKSFEPPSSSSAMCLKESLTPVLGKFIPTDGLVISKSGPLSMHASQLYEFLWSGDTIGLSVHASTLNLSTRSEWPEMDDDKYALYKLPTCNPKSGQEYAGLWGGTFGWPPGRPNEDKGTALFFLFLSYEESEGEQLLTATKILEGNHYVDHPNGSAMFIVNVGELSTDPFPLETDGDFATLDIKHTYTGNGIADGYGFRYPGSKPGSLFAFQDDLLAFVWKESRTVLTLQRIDLQELLRNGERVPALPPIENFTYLMRSYSNVYTSFSNSTSAG